MHITTEFEGMDLPHIRSLSRVEYAGSCNPPIAPHIHRDCFEICCHYEGAQHYELGGKVYEVHSGDIFIAMPGELHSTGAWTEEKSKFYYIIFSCLPDTAHFLGLDSAASDAIRDTLFSIQTRLFHGTPALKKLLEEVLEISKSDSPFRRARTVGLLTEFFYQLTRILGGKVATKEALPDDIREAVRYLETHLEEPYCAADLARRIHLSLPQFQRKFRLSTGFSPHDYALRLKMERARSLLADSPLKVTEISYMLGFSSSQHFSNAFRQYVGQTPTAYRKKAAGT